MITKILKIKLVVPITKIRLMIVYPACPAANFTGMFAISAECLVMVNTDGMAQTPVMIPRIRLFFPYVLNRFRGRLLYRRGNALCMKRHTDTN